MTVIDHALTLDSTGNPSAEALTGAHVFFYDGVCVYCKGIVEACLAADRDRLFYYSPLQSPFAQQVLGEYGIDSTRLLSMYVVSDYRTSDEALHRAAPASNFVLLRLHGDLRGVGEQNAAKPREQQDAEYKDTADNRYERYGKMEHVWIDTAALRDRFVY
jgi:predicted DCC family thiol-disulfide oxidoreductase YuxK